MQRRFLTTRTDEVMVMYSTDRGGMPTKPVVTTLTSANEEFARWVKENDFQALQDRDGTAWSVSVETTQIPDPRNLKGGIWKIMIHVKAVVRAEDLIAQGVLDDASDERLLELIGDAEITLRMRPIVLEANDADDARTALIEQLPSLKSHLANTALAPIKRSLVGRWLDDSRRFG